MASLLAQGALTNFRASEAEAQKLVADTEALELACISSDLVWSRLVSSRYELSPAKHDDAVCQSVVRHVRDRTRAARGRQRTGCMHTRRWARGGGRSREATRDRAGLREMAARPVSLRAENSWSAGYMVIRVTPPSTTSSESLSSFHA